NKPAHPQIYTLSLHDALPISSASGLVNHVLCADLQDIEIAGGQAGYQQASATEIEYGVMDVELARDHLSSLPRGHMHVGDVESRSEEHTSELQSRGHLVCRLL